MTGEMNMARIQGQGGGLHLGKNSFYELVETRVGTRRGSKPYLGKFSANGQLLSSDCYHNWWYMNQGRERKGRWTNTKCFLLEKILSLNIVSYFFLQIYMYGRYFSPNRLGNIYVILHFIIVLH